MKSDCTAGKLTLATTPALDMRRLSVPLRATILAYHQHLVERNALDFPDLLYRTWAMRFQWIQMDEVQDTNVSEYEVIRLLATHAATLSHRRTQSHPAPSLPEGTEPEIHHALDTGAEAEWIAKRLSQLRVASDAGRIGILTRTHKRCAAISDSLKHHGIPHFTVEQFDFFRRQEIKDLLARLHLLLNPADSGALQKLFTHPDLLQIRSITPRSCPARELFLRTLYMPSIYQPRRPRASPLWQLVQPRLG